jgi:hypothetical protein
MPSEGGLPGLDVTFPLRKPPKYEVMLPQIVEMTEAGSGVDLISRALGIGAEVVRAYDFANRGACAKGFPRRDVARVEA